MSTLISAGAGFLVGATIAWLLTRARWQTTVHKREQRVVELTTLLDSERRSAPERVALLEQANARFRDAFAALSAEALRQNNDTFLGQAGAAFALLREHAASDLQTRQQTITDLVQPMRQTLEKVEGTLHDVELARVDAYRTLTEQVRAMADTERALQTQTKGLVDALRSPTVRGRWGEMQLTRVCELAGMLDHCDFVSQETATTADGRLRPDVKVRLPGGKIIIVDAKTPLQAYLSAVEAPDETTRQALLRDHARQVKDHINALSAKSYWSQFAETPEFVVMFLPGEMFFSAALQVDPGLIEYGVEQHVIPASPTTLIALLRAAAYGWQQDRIARSAEQISAVGRELYERIRVFMGHYTELRKGLQRAVDAYNKSVGSLEHSVLPQARRFQDFGAAGSGELKDVPAIETHLRAPDVTDVMLLATPESSNGVE